MNVRIEFIKEICDIYEKTGANITDIAKAMGMDQRISPLFLKPGPGIGDSCFPKDSIALAKIGEKLGLDLQIINDSIISNISRKKSFANKVIMLSDHKNLEGKTISLLGLTFKANTDDSRYSPAINLVEELSKKNDLDIKNKKSYVCVDDDDKVLGTFFYDYGYRIEPSYNKIENGKWKMENDPADHFPLSVKKSPLTY